MYCITPQLHASRAKSSASSTATNHCNGPGEHSEVSQSNKYQLNAPNAILIVTKNL